MKTFGERIRELRKEKGLSQFELAERVGLNQSALCQVEKRNFPLPAKIAVGQLLDGLELSADVCIELANLYQATHKGSNGTRNVPEPRVRSRQQHCQDEAPIPALEPPEAPERDLSRESRVKARVRAKPGVLEERARVPPQPRPPVLEFPLQAADGQRLGRAWVDDVDVGEAKAGGLVGVQYQLDGSDIVHTHLVGVDAGQNTRDGIAVVLLLIKEPSNEHADQAASPNEP